MTQEEAWLALDKDLEGLMSMSDDEDLNCSISHR